MFEDENPNWESELQQRVGEMLSGRLNPLQAELAQLQSAVSAASARLQEQAQAAPTAAETAPLTAHVKSLFEAAASKAEQQFQARLHAEVEQSRAALRQLLEAEFQTRLEQSQAAAQQAAESAAEQHRAQLAALTASQALNVAAVAPAPTPPNYSLLKTAIEEIDAQRTQSETLTALITRAAHFSPRIAFYVVKSGEAVGWKALGFDNGLSDETARSLAVSIQAPSLLGQALNEQHTAIALSPSQGDIAPVLGRFSNPVPAGAVAVPLVVRGKAAAVLYADSGTEADDSVQLEALETLVHVASMAIELLPVRRNAGDVARPQPTVQPSAQPAAPATTPPAAAQPAEPPAAAPAAVEAPAPVPAPEPVYQAPVYEPSPYTAPAPPEPSPVAAAPVHAPAYADEYAGDPTTNKPADWQPAVSAPAPDYAAQAQFIQPEAVPFESRPTVEAPVPAAVYAEAPSEPEAPAPAPEHEAEPPSIFDLLRGNAAEPAVSTPPPPVAFPSYVPPEASAPGFPSESGQRPNAALPDWMQRLQEDEAAPEAPATPPAKPAWTAVEESFSPAPPVVPAPPTPPPIRLPSLSDFANRAEDAETDRLPMPAPTPPPPPIAPFQAEAPSVRFSFNQPSEPPRYAAPSLSVTNAATETEVRAHNDARRFARLLVSEIKLYNAAKVNEGRRQADLYDRLHDEIDRSRKVYDKRVSPAVAQKFDYFYDELVQTLAEGDPSKLGENCPGPVMVG